uniref:Tudor domain-containing protein n=1 Tax=Caenorhabditis tropicalis TaxID=1561998 RepID=A0A1I7V0L2_9PELO
MSWNDEMIERQRASETNSCRDIVEVPLGSSYKIRKLMEEYPQFLWKYSEGSTVPGYVIKIAEQLEREFYGANSVPIDLYPCEYFRIMEHSLPTELALQPKRFDKAQEQLHEKLQLYYENNESDLLISNEHLIPRIACAVRIQNKWYRGRLENIPVGGIWAYVLLVDVGTSRQVMKNDVRNLPFKFGHYPPMIVKARIRGISPSFL